MKIINLFFIFPSLIAFIWLMVGGIPGLILLLLAITSKDTTQKKRYYKWVKICFGGILLLLFLVILRFIIALIGGLLNIPLQ